MKFRDLKKMKFIIISKIILLIFLSILIGNINSVQNDLKDRNKINTENSIQIKFSDKNNKNNLKVLEDLKETKDVVIKYYNMDILETQTNDTGNIQGIYVNDDYFIDLKIKSGRLFTKDDMNSSKGLAVIGENIEKYTEKKGDKQYIISGNDTFEVIGVFKETKGFNNSDFIFYNLNSILNKPQKLNSTNWIIDSNSNELTQHDLISIVKKIAQKYNNEIAVYENGGDRYNPNTTYIFILSSMIIAFLLTCITIIMSLIRSVIMWINKLYLELGVRMCCGANKYDLINLIITKYIKATIISLIVSIITIYFLTLSNIDIIYFDFNAKILGIVMIIEIFIGFISILLFSKRLKKLTISQILKGSK